MGGDGATGDVGEDGREGVGGMCAESIDLGELVARSAEADLQPFDLPHPALAACFIDPGVQVVPDLDQPGALSRIGAQQGTAEAGVLVDAGCGEGSAACPERNFPSLEMAEELLPFGVGGGAVFLPGTGGPPPGDEGTVRRDDLFGVDRLWGSQILEL